MHATYINVKFDSAKVLFVMLILFRRFRIINRSRRLANVKIEKRKRGKLKE